MSLRICAVVPAAGLGTRLGLQVPKILAPLGEGLTVWSLLRERLLPLVRRITLVVAPGVMAQSGDLLAPALQPRRVLLRVQEEPLGMAHAVFCARDTWQDCEGVLVVWGDQVHVSARTLARTIEVHEMGGGSRFTIPVVSLPEPYVQYVFGPDGGLLEVREAREGDVIEGPGLGDVGAFLFATQGLDAAWEAYLRPSAPHDPTATACPVGDAAPISRGGARTGQLNLLPFLRFLARQRGWESRAFAIDDPVEARGINTPEDLRFFADLYAPLTNPPRRPDVP